jgi:hypothetical protein
MIFYITLNDATTELSRALYNTKFYEKFLDRIGIDQHRYMQQLLLDFIWSSYINLYGIKCFKGKKISNKQEIVSRDYLPMGNTHKYKWKIDCKKKRVKTSYEPAHPDLDKDKAAWIEKILRESKPSEIVEIMSLNLNSILSFNNDLLYTDISIKRTDLAFLIGNLENYLKGIFSTDEKKKKFSIMKFIKFWKNDEKVV